MQTKPTTKPETPVAQFLRDLTLPDCIIQAGAANKVDILLTPENCEAYLSQNQDKDLYFLAGVSPSVGLQRASDEDVLMKHHFYLDFDIRKQSEGRGEEISDSDIKDIGDGIIHSLNEHSHLSQWSYYDFSGNGIHIHYFGDPVPSPERTAWRMGMTDFLRQTEEATDGWKPDYGCTNIARIGRLPESHNCKNERHVLVEILGHQDKRFDMNLILRRGEELLAQAEEETRSRAEQVSVSVGGAEDAFAAIQKLPIANLLCRLKGWETDGRNFWELHNRKHKACFVPDGKNFVFHGGTDHLPATHEGFSPFTLVKEDKQLDSAKTFAWFKEHYPEIAALSKKKRQRSGKEVVSESKMEAAAPTTEEPIDLAQFSPMSAKELLSVLGLTIKKDEENKLIAFLCALSCYTDDAQFNVIFNAPSSAGKSYIPLEIAQLFPSVDLREIGYASSQAFFHEEGSFDKERNVHVIDLSRKLLIFIDQPTPVLLERLRPLLSHDSRVITAKITDKSKSQGNRTKTVEIHGFPAVMFCTANLKMDEQENTRFFLLSPETTQEKIRASIQEAVKKTSDKQKYVGILQANPERALLRERIKAIREAHINDVVITDTTAIEAVFLNGETYLQPRHSRDVKRLMSFVKILALLNFMHRRREENTIYAEPEDIAEALALWKVIAESQEYNLSPYLFNFYKEIIVPAYEEKKADTPNDPFSAIQPGLTHQDILTAHHKVYHRMLEIWKLRQEILTMLEAAGLITQEPDPMDRRRTLVRPTLALSISSKEKTNESEQGDASIF